MRQPQTVLPNSAYRVGCLSENVAAMLRGHPYMMSALRVEGVSPKEDVVREVA